VLIASTPAVLLLERAESTPTLPVTLTSASTTMVALMSTALSSLNVCVNGRNELL
jgi:hypothetical protein